MDQGVTRFSVGDVLPSLQVLTAASGVYDLRDQRLAGDPIVLLCDAPGAAARAPSDAERQGIEAMGAHLVTVRGAQPGPTPAGTYFDPEHRMAGLFGFTGPSLVIIDPAFRLEAVLPGAAFAAAEAVCQMHREADALVFGPGIAPVLVVPDVLDDEQIERLLDYWEREDKLKDGVSANAAAESVTQRSDFKRRTDVLLAEKELFLQVKDRIVATAVPLMVRAFGFETASMEALRIGCYDSADQGFFRRHRDNATKFTAHRRFAMSLNLNTGDYEGGRLNFPEFGHSVYDAPPGTAIIFSCSLLHEAQPVTAGRRFALFTFFTDRAGAARQDEMMRAHTASAGVDFG